MKERGKENIRKITSSLYF